MARIAKGILLLMVIVLTMAGGCAPGQENREDPGVDAPLQEVVAGLGRDPGEQYGYGAHPPLTRVLEPLLFQDVELGLKPGLAVGWETSSDGLTWTLELAAGVTFHDGTPFDTEAVVHNLERVSKTWPGRLGSVEEIEAVDELLVEVRHREPFAPFLYALAWPGSAMISPGAVAEDGKVMEPVGTGPFMRESWDPGEQMVLVRNENYWGDPATLERITLKFIPDPTTRMMALEKGEIQMIIDTGGVLPEHVSTLLLHPEIDVMTIPGAVPHYMSLNTKKVPLDDVRVRLAVMHAIDPESMIGYALEGYGKSMTSIIPHSEQDWLHPRSLYDFNNPERARELLQEAGWQDGGGRGVLQKNGEELSLKLLLSSALAGRWPYIPMAEIMQAQLSAVGFEVEIEVVEAGLWRETLEKGGAHMSMRPWAGISPQSRLQEWLHSKGENTLSMGTFYHNPKVDDLIDGLLKTTGDTPARELSAAIQEIAAAEVPVIPIYDEVLINAVRGNIKGYVLHPWFLINWEDIYVAD